MSLQFGQNSFTVSNPGRSERPHGTTLHPLQYTRGHEPNTPASYLSTCESTDLGRVWCMNVYVNAYHSLQPGPCQYVPLVAEPIEKLRGCLDN